MIGKSNGKSVNNIKGESVNITLLTNQTNHIDLIGAVITVSYDNTQQTYTWNGNTITIQILPFTDYSISCSSVNGYASPLTFSATSQVGYSRQLNLQYNTEIVSVTLSADNGQSVNGQKVTINGTQHTWNGTAITQKVAFGTKYTVSVNDKDGYTKPANQTFTANQLKRNCSMVYAEQKLGVFIEDTYGNLYRHNEWPSSGRKKNAIVILTNSVKRRLAFDHAQSCPQSFNHINARNYLSSVDEATAKTLYNGKSNTEKLYQAAYEDDINLNSNVNFVWPNGDTGSHLPSLGELMLIYNNKDAINTCLKVFGTYERLPSSFCWSSSVAEYSDGNDYTYFYCLNLYSDGPEIVWGEGSNGALGYQMLRMSNY